MSWDKTKIRQYIDWLTRKKLLGLSILAASVVLASIIIFTGPSAEPQARTERAWPVSVMTAHPDTRSPTLVAFGKVESRQVANLKTSITAPVAEVVVSEGTWVSTGDPLVILDDQEMRLALAVTNAEYKKRLAQLASARADFELANKITANYQELTTIAEAKLKRHLDLYKNKMVSNGILDEVRREASEHTIRLERHLADLKIFPFIIQQHEASVAEGQALMHKAELDLQQTRIVAPFQGRVISTYVAPGDRVLPGATVVQLADYDGLEVRASIPASVGSALRARFQQNLPVVAHGTLDGRHIPFTLARLSGNVKYGQSGLDAFFKTDSDNALDIGRVVNLNITLPLENDVIALPVQSIYENNRIYLVEDNRLRSIEIEQVGDYVNNEGQYQVLVRSKEIHAGDQLITTQLPRAITGLLVEPISAIALESILAADIKSDDERLTQ
jgi:HlyD family secretion protein